MSAAEPAGVIARAVAERVRQAPPLSPRQRDTLAGLLRPVVRRRGKARAA